MITVQAYKHEGSGEVFLSKEEYELHDKTWQKLEQKRLKKEEHKRKTKEDIDETQKKLQQVIELSKDHDNRKAIYIRDKTNDTTMKIDEYTSIIKKHQLALKICKESLKNQKIEYTIEFEKNNPNCYATRRRMLTEHLSKLILKQQNL